jgi:hypothetical protein
MNNKKANDRQEGGDHYQTGDGNPQHWDFAWQQGYDQFQYCITKYVDRHKKKNGLVDLRKARHHLDKYIELLEEEEQDQGEVPAYKFESDPSTVPGMNRLSSTLGRAIASHERDRVSLVSEGKSSADMCVKTGHEWAETAGRLSKESGRLIQTFECLRCSAQGEQL